MMTLYVSFRDKPRHHIQHILFFLLIPCVVWLTSGCAGLVSGAGGTGQPSAQAVKIISVQATNPTPTGFQVDWLTNIPANSQVQYGTSPAYGNSTPVIPTTVTAHKMALTSLAAGTLYHYRVISTDANKNQAASDDLTAVTGGDTTPPTVSIISPPSGANLSGIVNVTANATDNTAIASVQFQLDGANAGAAVTAAPYSYSWDTTKTANGIHTLKAIAKDTAGNSTTSTSDLVTVKKAGATPVVSITAPANGSTVSGAVGVTASATSSVGVASVQFQLDGANAGAAVTAAPYSYS